ncbi:S41 family peptidase [Chryseobacterium sp. MIQD13]|uniref:S41 family peptidase n=1 Tax=Chryseobacterium sp. MIQD13 TaxID=3422310 RepID=UPI003D2E1738
MKKITLSIVILATGVFVHAQMQNPDFEETENNLPITWKSRPTEAYEVKSDNTVKYSGKNSLQITSTADASGKMQTFSQLIPIPGSGLRKVRLSGYIRSENTAGSIALWAQVKNEEKNTIDFGNSKTQNNNIIPNSDWKEYSLEFVLDDTAKNFLFGGFLSGNGKVWFDHFTVSEIPFSSKPSSEKALAYIKEFKNIVKKNSIFKNQINWTLLEKDLKKISKGMETVEDTGPAIQYIMRTLKVSGDNHSFIDSKENVEKKAVSNTVAIEPEFKLTDQNIGYIMVPAFSSRSKEVGISFAEKIQGMIQKLDTENTVKGWVVDLRKNTGGNMYPMITGLGPLTGEGILGYFTSDKGKHAWSYKKGTTGYGLAVSNPYSVKSPEIKIAVLIGPGTASSGEATAISFIGKTNVKTFGQPSAGYTSGNRGFKLSDGRSLLLASSYEMDRKGKEYKEKIQPDVLVPVSENTDSDADLTAATQWILE